MSNLLKNSYVFTHSTKKEQDAIVLKYCSITATNQNKKNLHKYKGKKQTIIK